jgi:hypothetical protein
VEVEKMRVEVEEKRMKIPGVEKMRVEVERRTRRMIAKKMDHEPNHEVETDNKGVQGGIISLSDQRGEMQKSLLQKKKNKLSKHIHSNSCVFKSNKMNSRAMMPRWKI